MAIGPTIRRLVGPKLERSLSGAYRRVFVDLDAVARILAPHCPSAGRILDIGGGDGELINKLLSIRPDLWVDMVDISPAVGKFVAPEIQDRVRVIPNTAVESLALEHSSYDAALVSDVMHHLPPSYRKAFLTAVHARLKPQGVLLVKDIEPGHPIAHLSVFCDMYVSGDKGVTLVSMHDLELLTAHLPAKSRTEVGLVQEDAPNYLYKLTFA